MDALLSFFQSIEPQHWLVLGLVLLIAEMASGTTYLLWPAVAAFLTALIAWTGATAWSGELAVFAILVLVLTAFGRPIVQRWRAEGAANGLNDRAQALVGVRGEIIKFDNGVGSVKVGDTVWRVASDEALAPGQQVEVASVDGATLTVKRVT